MLLTPQERESLILQELLNREKQISALETELEIHLKDPISGAPNDGLWLSRRVMPSRLDARLKLIEAAEKYVGVKELGGDNKGPEVEAFQRAVDGKAQGEPWCAAACMYWIDKIERDMGMVSFVSKAEHCLTVWQKTPESLRLKKPEPGCLVIWQHANSSSGHMGLVKDLVGETTFVSIEGNTGDGLGVVREGDGVYKRTRSIAGSGYMRVVGFLKVF